MSNPEVFVVNLAGVDCFTFIDYIEAMRISGSFSDFIGNLQKIRYKGGNISFESRNHFFTDWREFNADLTEDVTEEVGKETAVRLRKILNKKEYGTCWVPGLPQVEREIRYIPSGAVNDKVADRLRTGDYAGVYTDAPGLDVSHVGIIIRDGDLVYLRHASSRRKKVVDADLRNYLSDKPGLLVFRPKE
jgi:hypothetical protein